MPRSSSCPACHGPLADSPQPWTSLSKPRALLQLLPILRAELTPLPLGPTVVPCDHCPRDQDTRAQARGPASPPDCEPLRAGASFAHLLPGGWSGPGLGRGLTGCVKGSNKHPLRCSCSLSLGAQTHDCPVSRGPQGSVPHGCPVSRGPRGSVPHGCPVSRGPRGSVPHGCPVSRGPRGSVRHDAAPCPGAPGAQSGTMLQAIWMVSVLTWQESDAHTPLGRAHTFQKVWVVQGPSTGCSLPPEKCCRLWGFPEAGPH